MTSKQILCKIWRKFCDFAIYVAPIDTFLNINVVNLTMKFCEQTWNKLLITRIDLSNNAKVVTFFRGHIWSTFSASWNFFGGIVHLNFRKNVKIIWNFYHTDILVTETRCLRMKILEPFFRNLQALKHWFFCWFLAFFKHYLPRKDDVVPKIRWHYPGSRIWCRSWISNYNVIQNGGPIS